VAGWWAIHPEEQPLHSASVLCFGPLLRFDSLLLRTPDPIRRFLSSTRTTVPYTLEHDYSSGSGLECPQDWECRLRIGCGLQVCAADHVGSWEGSRFGGCCWRFLVTRGCASQGVTFGQTTSSESASR
jgi:hypothetical protein